MSKFHLIFARVFDEAGSDCGIGGFIAIRDEDPGLEIGAREPTMGFARHTGNRSIGLTISLSMNRAC